MEDFTGYFNLAFEIDKLFEENDDTFGPNDFLFNNSINKETDKLFEENDDTFGANDFLFNNSLNKETKPITNKVQEDTGPNIPNLHASNPAMLFISCSSINLCHVSLLLTITN